MSKSGTKDIKTPDSKMHSIFQIIGTTKIRAKDTRDNEGNQGIGIPTHTLKIEPLEAITGGVCSSLAVATGLPRDQFCVNSYVFVSADRFCYPIVEVKSEIAIAVDLIQSVIFRLLGHVKRSDPHTKRLFPGDITELAEQAETEIHAAATDILTRYGDSPVTTPSQIYVGGNAIAAEFKGMFASKPDLSDLKPVLLELEGHVDGYRAKKREIFLETKDGSQIIHWENDQQVIGNLSLAQRSNLFIFKISRTIDQRGNPINTLVSIKEK
jgi:hypothetical protein